MPKGLYRSDDWAQVAYEGAAEVPVPRSKYEDQGYKPPFDELPTQQEFEAARNA